MREIKFRVWHKKEEKMYSNLMLSFYHSKTGHFIASFKSGVYVTINTEDVVIMQYTGLKDKNGKEIYEGDILEFDFSAGKTNRRCHWYESSWYFDGFTYSEGEIELYATVKGNIFENPDLWKD